MKSRTQRRRDKIQTAARPNGRERDKQRRARVELAKTVVLAALFVSMVILASAEIVQTQRFNISPASDVDIKSLLVLHGDKKPGSIANYILPEFMGYKIGGVMRGIYGSEPWMRELYGLLDGYIAALLGDGGVCKTLPAGESEAVWRNCRSGDYIYVRYFSRLPASALYCAASGGKGGALADGAVPYIRELFITLSTVGTAVEYGFVTRSEDGNISVYKPKTDAVIPDFDISEFTAYNEISQLAEFSFLGDLTDYDAAAPRKSPDETGGAAAPGADITPETDGAEQENAVSAVSGLTDYYGLPDTTVLTGGEFAQRYIAAQGGAALTERVLDDGTVRALLELFGINADRTTPYKSKGYTTYLGESGRLRFSESGEIDYSGAFSGTGPSSDGVAVSEFLGYQSYGGNYTYNELLTAAASLLGSVKNITPALLGGDARLGLISVSSGETELELVFDYYYDNYRMIGAGPAVTLGFSGGRLISMTMKAAEITAGGPCVSIPQNWAAERLYADARENGAPPDERPYAEFTIFYNIKGTSSDGGAASDAESAPNTDEGAVSGSKSCVVAPVWAIATAKAKNP